MIKMGFHTLAMLTFGLGIRMPWGGRPSIPELAVIEFRDKPAGIEVEEKTGPASFKEGTVLYKDTKVKFKDS